MGAFVGLADRIEAPAMRIRWTGPALDDLESIRAYVSPRNAKAARKVIRVVFEAVEHLDATPWIGRPGRQTGTRELVLVSVSLIVAYRVRDEAIEVLRVLHTSRRWPRLPH